MGLSNSWDWKLKPSYFLLNPLTSTILDYILPLYPSIIYLSSSIHCTSSSILYPSSCTYHSCFLLSPILLPPFPLSASSILHSSTSHPHFLILYHPSSTLYSHPLLLLLYLPFLLHPSDSIHHSCSILYLQSFILHIIIQPSPVILHPSFSSLIHSSYCILHPSSYILFLFLHPPCFILYLLSFILHLQSFFLHFTLIPPSIICHSPPLILHPQFLIPTLIIYPSFIFILYSLFVIPPYSILHLLYLASSPPYSSHSTLHPSPSFILYPSSIPHLSFTLP